MKTKNLLFASILACLAFASCTKENENAVIPENIRGDEIQFQNGAVHCTSDIINAVDGTVFTDGATLVRTNNKVRMTFKVDGLNPGYAYTIWWVVWNNPEFCDTPFQCADIDFGNADAVEVEVMYAAGHVVGNSGKGNFAASLNENDASGSINDLFGLPSYGGLHDAMAAEVHLVLRSHGPAIPGEVNEQINTYGGGCTTNLPPFTEIPDEEGECGDYMFSIFLADCGE